jgi:GTP-binding protein YchF
MKCGIIGPPNVGKSSLFNSLVKKQMAEVANYAFCTINPNTASVPYYDQRLESIHQVTQSKKIVPSTLSFVDIAGIVKNAASNVGLGNEFLSNMSSVDVIIQVVRCFSQDFIGGEGEIQGDTDPIDHINYITLELMLWDYRMWKKYCEKDKKNTVLNEKLLKWLSEEKTVRDFLITLEDKERQYYNTALNSLQMITEKPMIIACNISNRENDQKNIDLVIEKAKELKVPVQIICGNFFHSTVGMLEEDKKSMLSIVGIENDGVSELIAKAFEATGLIQFFTTGVEETRSWNINKGINAKDAASVIHSDISDNFITAEVLNWDVLVRENGWLNCKNKGLIHNEGKQYIVKDGDIIIFKHGGKKK